MLNQGFRGWVLALTVGWLGLAGARGEAMLQLFNVNWTELVQKMPEIAEAGYTSLWLPPPAKAGSVFSVGYDLFDPFDLGDLNQRGTIPTKYGTKAQLLKVVETAHRFGIRVYFDNIMNHRGFDVPGYNASTPTNLYPGMVPGDFHLQIIAGGFFRNWPNISDFNNLWQVQNQPLFGLLDIANEPGNNNVNFGAALGGVIAKPVFIRQPANLNYYMDATKPGIGGVWHPFNGTNGVPIAEDVNIYLTRAAMWILSETKCDGFRFDAVKHTPSGFFGDTSDNANGYTGGIQAMFDYVHGYGSNVTGNGYAETDGNRNSVFDTETPRNDAMLFGEHLGEPPSFSEYLARGLRLLNSPYQNQLNNVLGNPSASLSGLEQRDYRPYPDAFTGPQSVLFAQSHDNGYSNHRELQHAYNFMREGLPEIYSDGYNQSTGSSPFPAVANANYLGEFGDNKMPDVAYLHHQLARGGTRPRWGDNDIVAFERYDYRDVDPATAYDNPDATVALFAMNDNYASDISFDDGAAQTTSGTYYDCFPVSSSRGQGLVVGFRPGSVLAQLADSPNKGSACGKLLVRYATQVLQDAITNINNPDPVMRKIYVGTQALAPNGGAIELKVPKGGYVMYGYQWPEPSRASLKDAITFRQGGAEPARITVTRKDGINGDAGFNPAYPFRMRGSLDPNGNVVGGTHLSNLTYSIDIPVLTNAPFDIVMRSDASASNVLVKLDGGLDLNSQMGLGPLSGLDRRDNRPGYATDLFLGYERATNQFRYGPEKFAATSISRDNVTSLGAETYYYTVGGASLIVNGAGNGAGITNSTANWVYHDPAATNTAVGGGSVTQRNPLNPTNPQPVEIWVKAGYQFQINRCYIYYTTDGTNPEGSFGTGLGTTRVVQATFANDDSADGTIDWWKGIIPAANQVRYKIALFKDNIPPITDADNAKLYGLNQAVITNFNPATATVWLHNDLSTNNVATGLATGFHIVRTRTFLPRPGKSGVFNTFLQTFYYDGQLPTGVIAFPASDGGTINNSTYQVVVRADSSVTGVDFNIADSDPANDDFTTHQTNGNGTVDGTVGGAPVFVNATSVTPDPTLSQQYPNYPQEYRFTYSSVPSSGSANITVRLKEFSTPAYPNRLTTLTRTVNTLAPVNILQIGNPATDGSLLVLYSTNTYTLQTCFTPTLTTNNANLFSIYINGSLQPRASYIFRAPGAVAGCPGLRSLLYGWTGAAPGTNVIQVFFTNAITLSDTRTVLVVRPDDPTDSDGDGVPDWMEYLSGTDPHDPNSLLRITGLVPANAAVIWDSVSNLNYRVWATTNLGAPLAPVSDLIRANGSTTVWPDGSPDPTNKFYRVQVVP